jgi:hypothetical protein
MEYSCGANKVRKMNLHKRKDDSFAVSGPDEMLEEDATDFRSKGAGLFDQLRKHHALLEHEVHSETDNAVGSSTVLSVEDSQRDEDISLLDDTAADESSEKMMPPEARRALVSLLRQGVILYSQKAKLFESLCQHQSAVRRHLSEVYLKLVLDEKAGVAFVAGIRSKEDEELENLDDEEPVSLISRRTLSIYDTLLLLVLRKHYQDRETSGEQRIVIDTERVESYLTPFLPLTNSSKSDRKQLNAALQKMVTKKILGPVRGSDDRFEITPVIRYVVNAEFLESMLNEYLKLARENGLLNENEGGAGINGAKGGENGR